MATTCWDSQGLIFVEYLEKDKTVTGPYYTKLLHRFDTELRKKKVTLGEENSALPP